LAGRATSRSRSPERASSGEAADRTAGVARHKKKKHIPGKTVRAQFTKSIATLILAPAQRMAKIFVRITFFALDVKQKVGWKAVN
jgi:hypothetical protein